MGQRAELLAALTRRAGASLAPTIMEKQEDMALLMLETPCRAGKEGITELERKRTVLIPRSWESALEDYLVYKQSQGRRYDTLRDIRQKVSQFFRTYPTVWPSGLKRAAQDWLGEKGLKPATYNLRLSALRGFFEWAVGEGLIADNPVRGYRALPREPRIVDIPDSVLEQLLDLPNKSRFVGLRDHALIMLT